MENTPFSKFGKTTTLVEFVNWLDNWLSLMPTENVCLILRAVPGTGKSYVRKTIQDGLSNKFSVDSVSADYFFIDKQTGEYKFDPEKLGAAHGTSQRFFERALVAKTRLVMVDNTNLKQRDWNVYRDVARKHEYKVAVLNISCSREVAFKRQAHGVPESSHIKMFEAFNNFNYSVAGQNTEYYHIVNG